MANTGDIRRESGDISPTNYIRPGVEDRSSASILGALGETAIAVDQQLAQKRFGDALETLRSQYITGGSPVVAEAQQGVGAEDDADVGPQLTEGDKRSLKDFASVLNDHDQAVAQGRMSYDSFRIRAERLYRIAISKRPGLAAEFRQTAANLMGMDVVGSTVEVLAQMEGARQRSAKDAADAEFQGMKKKHDVFIDRMKDLNMELPPGINPYTPEFENYIQQVTPNLNRILADVSAAESTGRTAKMLTDQGQIDVGKNTLAFENEVQAGISGSWVAVSSAVNLLEKTGMINNPEAVRAEALKVKTGLDSLRSRLMATGKSLRLDDDTIGAALARINAADQELTAILGNEDQTKMAQNAVSWLKAKTQMAMLSNEQTRQSSVFLSLFPGEISNTLVAKLGADLAVVAGQAMNETAPAKLMAANGYNILTSTLPEVFSDPNADERTIAGGALLTEKALQSMYLIPDRDYNVENFLGSQRGVLTALKQQSRQIEQKFTPDQKESLALDFAGATTNSWRMVQAGLLAKHPAMKGRTSLDLRAPGGQVIVLANPTEAESKAVREANARLRINDVAQVAMALTGAKTKEEALGFVGAQFAPTMTRIRQDAQRREAADKARQATQRQAERSGTGTSQRTKWWLQNPNKG